MRTLASGLAFPEGPVVLRDGSIAVGEIGAGRVTRVTLDGVSSLLADTGGGPNGLALGPDGALYVCNNGGVTAAHVAGPDYAGGSIQRIDIASGTVTTLYSACGDHRLSAPNDIVFDAHGGFWFTDSGKKFARHREQGALYYARTDGSHIEEAAYGLLAPNGVALSPDERTLYFTETETSRLIALPIIAPGKFETLPFPAPGGGRLVCGLPGFQFFDSIAVQADGDICVATLVTGCIQIIAPDGRLVATHAVPDPYPTNLCFGGADMSSAYVTLVETGRLVEIPWPVAGLRLHDGRA
ncbi:SMP-30/gluconolactonase/LRE family protein [soil metagenome]